MFRKVSFMWTCHFPKPLCHWLEKSHFLTPSGSVHLLSVPSPTGNQLAPHHESLVPLLGPWVCFICNTQARTLQYSSKKLVPLQGPQVCQIIKTTNNIFPLFWWWQTMIPKSFPLTVYSPLLYIPPYLATYSLLPPFGIIKKICSKPLSQHKYWTRSERISNQTVEEKHSQKNIGRTTKE